MTRLFLLLLALPFSLREPVLGANSDCGHSCLGTWATEYAYDSAGRLFSVTADDHRAEYHYHPVHHRIAQVSFRPAGTGSSPPVLHNTRQYDDLRRLAGTTWHTASTGSSPTPLVHFGYAYNNIDQRTKQSHLDGTSWDYGYNSAGELTLADKMDAAGTTYYPGRQFRYGYDGIGNRTSQESGGDTSGANRRSDALTPAVLNQYSSIAHSGELDITGQAPSATPITVNAATATRVGEYFHGEVSGDNSSGPLWEGVTVSDGSNPVSGDLFVPAATTAPSYDLDGNCLSDGGWDYVWDAANRLVSATRSSAAQTAGAPYRRYEYAYDYLDRRIRAERFDSAQGNPVATTHYLYDGWNCIAELDESLEPVRTYTWGLDLSGTGPATAGSRYGGSGGGVGGLLWIEDNTSQNDDLHFAAYDGIGNLTNLIAEDGTELTASYEYDPFGNLLRATGPYAAENPVRFSTKFHNPETGLSYYGYRYYNPAQGRWLNRDPIAESGGANVYGFVANEPTNAIDLLGLSAGALAAPVPQGIGIAGEGMGAAELAKWRDAARVAGRYARRGGPVSAIVVGGAIAAAGGLSLAEEALVYNQTVAAAAVAQGSWCQSYTAQMRAAFTAAELMVAAASAAPCEEFSQNFLLAAEVALATAERFLGLYDSFKCPGLTAVTTAFNESARGIRTSMMKAASTTGSKSGSKTLDELSSSGGTAKLPNGLTRAGHAFEKHASGQRSASSKFPPLEGNIGAKNAAGQDILDDILTDPGTTRSLVTGGNFKGGTRFTTPDGRQAVFDKDGVFQYFGE